MKSTAHLIDVNRAIKSCAKRLLCFKARCGARGRWVRGEVGRCVQMFAESNKIISDTCRRSLPALLGQGEVPDRAEAESDCQF